MDTMYDPGDWRRNYLECAFKCITPTKPPITLNSVCLSCARNCQAAAQLRRRVKGNRKCDCRKSGMCTCTWSTIRAAFDEIAGEDFCIGPNQLRGLLVTLRKPDPVEKENMDDCLAYFATSEALKKAADLEKERAEKRERERVEAMGDKSKLKEYNERQKRRAAQDSDSDDEEALDALEFCSEPRIGPLEFEQWYRDYFDVIESASEDEYADDDASARK
jgi:hypothetical protein